MYSPVSAPCLSATRSAVSVLLHAPSISGSVHAGTVCCISPDVCTPTLPQQVLSLLSPRVPPTRLARGRVYFNCIVMRQYVFADNRFFCLFCTLKKSLAAWCAGSAAFLMLERLLFLHTTSQLVSQHGSWKLRPLH